MDNENTDLDTIVIETLGEENEVEEQETVELSEETVEVVEETVEAAVVEDDDDRGKLAPPTVDEVLELAAEMGCVIKEQTFHKLTAPTENKKAVYVAKTKRGLTRIDFSGFKVSHPLIKTITEEEAKEANLGKVRGQLLYKDLDPIPSREQVLEACRTAFDEMLSEAEGDKLVSRKDKELAEAGE